MHLLTPYRPYLFFLLLLPLTIELIGFMGHCGGLLTGPGYPDYAIGQDAFVNYHADIDSTVGNWRPNNLRTRLVTDCFDVEMESNNYGARDADWDFDNAPRGIVLLGDSFLEGQGLPIDQTVASLLERQTGEQVFNLATAGHFGPTQYRLLFDKFSDRLKPSLLLIGLNLPNDIVDDSGSHPAYRGRYRPYLDGNYPSYTVGYRGARLASSKFKPTKKVTRSLKTVAEHYSILYRLYLSASNYAAQLAKPGYRAEGYFPTHHIAIADLERVKYNLAEIRRNTDVPVVVFTVPNQKYFTGNHSVAELSEVHAYFERELAAEGIDFIVASRLSSFDASDFHRCDPHWSARGNRKVADLILRELISKRYLLPSDHASKD